MPLIYRSMLADGDKPKIGPTAETLGVQIAPAARPDIAVDSAGLVRPNTGGMSVAPAWRLLPVHRVPRRLRPKLPGAAGKNALYCWRMGEGAFESGPIAVRLLLRLDPEAPSRHGLVEPSEEMAIADYQAELAATQDQWVIDEA